MHDEKNTRPRKNPKIQPFAREEIQRRLSSMNLRKVAAATGISGNAIYRLAKGEGEPLASTLEAVTVFLRKHAGEAVQSDAKGEGEQESSSSTDKSEVTGG